MSRNDVWAAVLAHGLLQPCRPNGSDKQIFGLNQQVLHADGSDQEAEKPIPAAQRTSCAKLADGQTIIVTTEVEQRLTPRWYMRRTTPHPAKMRNCSTRHSLLNAGGRVLLD